MINIALAIIGTLYATYTDLKTGEVPEWLTNTMIILGIIWCIMNYDVSKLWIIGGTAAAVFGVGYLFYIFGEMGGGDAKLFTGIALLIPFYSHEIYPFIIPIYMLSGIFFMVVMPLTYFRKVLENKKKIKEFVPKMRTLLLYEIILLGFGIFWAMKFEILGVLIIPIMMSALIIPFKNDLTRLFFAKQKQIQNIDEEDVIALELIGDSTKKKLALWRKTLTSFELVKLKQLAKKCKIKNLTVMDNLPKFVPYIFASLLLNLVFGDFIMLLFRLI